MRRARGGVCDAVHREPARPSVRRVVVAARRVREICRAFSSGFLAKSAGEHTTTQASSASFSLTSPGTGRSRSGCRCRCLPRAKFDELLAGRDAHVDVGVPVEELAEPRHEPARAERRNDADRLAPARARRLPEPAVDRVQPRENVAAARRPGPPVLVSSTRRARAAKERRGKLASSALIWWLTAVCVTRELARRAREAQVTRRGLEHAQAVERRQRERTREGGTAAYGMRNSHVSWKSIRWRGLRRDRYSKRHEALPLSLQPLRPQGADAARSHGSRSTSSSRCPTATAPSSRRSPAATSTCRCWSPTTAR